MGETWFLHGFERYNLLDFLNNLIRYMDFMILGQTIFYIFYYSLLFSIFFYLIIEKGVKNMK
jgi:hypothetical protein